MSDTVPAARIVVREPTGARELELPFAIGGAAARVVVPGVSAHEFLRIELRADQLLAVAAGDLRASLNGLPLAAEQLLRVGDVLAFASTRVLVREGSGALPLLELRHLAGNDTAPPLSPLLHVSADADDQDARVIAVAIGPGDAADTSLPERRQRAADKDQATRRWWIGGLLVAVVLAAFAVLSQLETITLILSPSDARVRADGWVSWQSDNALTVWPGQRLLRAERAGYRVLERSLVVKSSAPNSIELTLQKLPGLVDIDTGGVVAVALVDGAEAGRVPGALQISAGAHTLLLRAERYLDAAVTVQVTGMGRRQALRVRLAPSWGRLAVTSSTAGAQLFVGDTAAHALPAALDLPAGVHRLRVSAPGARDWLSFVLVKPAATTSVGPMVLGAPDAQLRVSSQPSGAGVTVAGVWRGRTPLQLPLPAGARYEVLVAQPGYTAVTRVVDAAPGARITLDARLAAVLVGLSVSGEPAEAELWIDGMARGRAPANLQLLAGTHRIEVRKPGMQTFSSSVELAATVARTLEYRLIPEGKPPGWTAPPAALNAKSGGTLRLINGGSYMMGSARREQGRRPNEGMTRVTLSRPFYIGTRELTNGEFRRFRADHASGVVDQRSIDLDAQPVTNVTWQQAVEYCNWLSTQESLPPAYESKDGSWVLKQPANNGYRLPTEAEWEFAARVVPGGLRRFEWGDELPIPPGIANIAGAEAAKVVDPVLPGYRDEYVAVAPVGRFPPNAFGLYDITGNVSEWTHDVYASFVDSTPVTDPLGPPAGARHTVRGANWRSATISELRLAWREGASEPSQEIGFRVARYAE